MRRDTDFAKRAGYILLVEDAASFWRLFARLAFGEFGVTNQRDISLLIAAASSKTWRRSAGGEWHVASFLIERFLGVPLDRRVSHLHSLAIELCDLDWDHSLSQVCPHEFKATIHLAISILQKCTTQVPHIGVVTTDALACTAVFDDMRDLGIAATDTLDICRQARCTTQSIKPVLFPLIVSLSSFLGTPTLIERGKIPDTVSIGGMPSYAYDASTKVGFFALKQLVEKNRELAKLLSRIGSFRDRQLILNEALFVAEGSAPALELSFPDFDRSLRSFRTEPPASSGRLASDLQTVLRAQIPHLNELRQEMYECL